MNIPFDSSFPRGAELPLSPGRYIETLIQLLGCENRPSLHGWYGVLLSSHYRCGRFHLPPRFHFLSYLFFLKLVTKGPEGTPCLSNRWRHGLAGTHPPAVTRLLLSLDSNSGCRRSFIRLHCHQTQVTEGSPSSWWKPFYFSVLCVSPCVCAFPQTETLEQEKIKFRVDQGHREKQMENTSPTFWGLCLRWERRRYLTWEVSEGVDHSLEVSVSGEYQCHHPSFSNAPYSEG